MRRILLFWPLVTSFYCTFNSIFLCENFEVDGTYEIRDGLTADMWRVSGPLGHTVGGYLSAQNGPIRSPKVRLKSSGDYCAEMFVYMPQGGAVTMYATDKEKERKYVWSKFFNRMRTWQMIQVPVEGLNGVFRLELDFEGDTLSIDEFTFHQNSCLSLCQQHEYSCRRMNECIDRAARCDDRIDCIDGSDEDACENDFLIGTTPFVLDFTTDSPFLVTGPTGTPSFGIATTSDLNLLDMMPLQTTADPFGDLVAWNDFFPTSDPLSTMQTLMMDFDFVTTPMPEFTLDDIFGGGDEKKEKKPKKEREKKKSKEKKKKKTKTPRNDQTMMDAPLSLDGLFFTTPEPQLSTDLLIETTQPSLFMSTDSAPLDISTPPVTITVSSEFATSLAPMTTQMTLDFTLPELMFSTGNPMTATPMIEWSTPDINLASGDAPLEIESSQVPLTSSPTNLLTTQPIMMSTMTASMSTISTKSTITTAVPPTTSTIESPTTTTTSTTSTTITTTTTTTMSIPDETMNYQTITFLSPFYRFFETRDTFRVRMRPGQALQTFVGDFSRNMSHPFPIERDFPVKLSPSFGVCFVIYQNLVYVADKTGVWRMNWDYRWQRLDQEFYMDGIQEWWMLTANMKTELPCRVYDDAIWFCGVYNGKMCVRLIVNADTGMWHFDHPFASGIARSGFGMAVTPDGILLVGGQTDDTTLGGRGLVDPAVGVVKSRRRRQSPMAFMNELMGFDLEEQNRAKAEIDDRNRLAQSIGDLELIYFNHTTDQYESRFGVDLPQDFERARAFDSVAIFNDQVIMVLNDVGGETKLLKTSLKMDAVEVIDEEMSQRTNPSVFRFQNKVYVMGGTWQHPGSNEKTDIPVEHNIIYFKADGRVSRVEKIDQNEFQQDRYSYFIFPEGDFTQWSEWSPCSASCGGGVIERRRRCVNLFVELVDNAAFSCGLEPRQSHKCNKHRCPLWAEWASWASCSASCGRDGVRQRSRECNGGLVGDEGCAEMADSDDAEITSISATHQEQPCARVFCPIEPKSTEWTEWTSCTKSCNGGRRMRAKRKCVTPKEKEKAEKPEKVKKTRQRRQFSMNDFLTMSGILSGQKDDVATSQSVTTTTKTITTARPGQTTATTTIASTTATRTTATSAATTDSVTMANLFETTTPELFDLDTTPMVTFPLLFTTANATAMPSLDDLFFTTPLPPLPLETSPPPILLETTAAAIEPVQIQIELEEEICDFPGYWKVVNETEKCNTDKCPGWTKWAEWDVCSVTCGAGVETRRRECRNGQVGVNVECPADDEIDTRAGCNDHQCPYLTQWSSWSPCPVTCGGAERKRSRECKFSLVTNIGCRNGTEEIEQCNTKLCPIFWAEWSNWGECSEYCGDGIRNRTRVCQNKTPLIGCDGNGTLSEPCNEGYCEGDFFEPQWAEWGAWGECSVSCGLGYASRERTCNGDTIGSRNCPWEGSIGNGPCENEPCPEWSNWGEWGACFTLNDEQLNCTDPLVVARNLIGTRDRVRMCHLCPYDEVFCRRPEDDKVCDELFATDPNNGKESEMCDCYTYISGEEVEALIEEGRELIQNGTIIMADDNSTDTIDTIVTIEESGSQPVVRNETNFYDDDDVVEVNYGSKTTAAWGEWAEWGSCSATCGFGKKLRERDCLEPGKLGDPGCGRRGQRQEMNCLQRRCRLHWMDWGEWTPCGATCGQGVRTRLRACSNPEKLGEPACLKTKRVDMEPCKEMVCVKWFEWTEWSTCSVSCGQGQKTRSRKCPDHAEPHQCPGPNVEFIYCNIPSDDERCLLPRQTWVPPELNEYNEGDYGMLMYDLFDLDSFQFQTTASSEDLLLGTTPLPLGEYFDPDMLTTPAFPPSMFTTAAPTIIENPFENIQRPDIWGPWQSWSPCSLACDNPEGRRSRIRLCLAVDANNCQMNGRVQAEKCVCEGETRVTTSVTTTTTTIATKPTPPPPHEENGWASWGPWQPCTRTCGEGKQSRRRHCPDQHDCYGGIAGSIEEVECDLGVCEQMTGWSTWSACSASCGEGAYRSRMNACMNKSWNGKVCPGVESMDEQLVEKQPCDYVECPHLGEWTLWTECDTLCPRKGIRSRVRNCHFGEPQVSPECMGDTTEYEECYHSACAYWAEWDEWSQCSQSCGGGEHLRHRPCVNGEVGDLNCNAGEEVDIMLCGTEECPHWSSWSKWSPCVHQCGNSTSLQTRHCVHAPFGDPGCPGIAERSKHCESTCSSRQECVDNSCQCWADAGWTYNSESGDCERIDVCLECHDAAVCNVATLECACLAGYEGDGYQCFDIDECTERTHNCDELAQCANNDGSYQCQCPVGYTADIETNACIDLDECQLRTHNCHAPSDWAAALEETRVKYNLVSSFCQNLVGSFTCTCKEPSFVGNGTHCEQVGPAIVAAQTQTKSQKKSSARIEVDTCVAVDGEIEFSFLISGSAPFMVESITQRAPYKVTIIEPKFNQTLFQPPFHVKILISGIPSEPLFANDEVYQIRVTDHQYAITFENGDIPVKADTERIIDVVMSSKQCSRLNENQQRAVQGTG